MKPFAVLVLSAVLLLLAIAGLGIGFWVVMKALEIAKNSREGSAVAVELISMAMAPFLVGTMALSGFTNVLAAEAKREEHGALLRDIREQLSHVAGSLDRD